MTQTTESAIKLLTTSHHLPVHNGYGSWICPKCQKLLVVNDMQQTDKGYHLIYDCPECQSSFAYISVTEFRLFEVIPQ